MSTDPVTFLMANLGSEVERLFHAIGEKNAERMHGAYKRACQILNEVQAFPGTRKVEGELTLLREVLDDSIREVPQLHIRLETVRKYFLPFALRVLSR